MKKKILVLGASGMLGSALSKRLINDDKFITYVYYRSNDHLNPFFNGATRVSIQDLNRENLNQILGDIRPDYVVNCIGVIKQRSEAKSHIESIELNSLLPHILSSLSYVHEYKLIHFSTDCVFTGEKGNYDEYSVKDATDLYGLSKSLGEVTDCKNTITLRTSIIGRELKTHSSLMDWFLLNPNDDVNGYDKAIFSGLTTYEVATVIQLIIEKFHSGLFNLSSDPIDKYHLLSLINDVWKTNKNINRYSQLNVNKSLNSDKFKKLYDYNTPSWRKQISESYEFYNKYY